MPKSFYILMLNALLFGACRPDTPKPEERPPQTSASEQPPQPEPPKTPEPSAQPESPEAPDQGVPAEESQKSEESRDKERASFSLPRFFGAASAKSQLDDLRQRQTKAQRFAEAGKFAEAVQEADYVASSILAGNLHQNGDDAQNAREFASLLDSAFTTLNECAARSEASQRPVPTSEPTSVRF